MTQEGSGSGTPQTTFTYDLTSEDTGIVQRSRVRLIVGDTQFELGPRPDNRNYTDTEMDTFISNEEGHLQRAAAASMEALAAEWATRAKRESLGPASHEMQQASSYLLQAQSLRRAHGHSANLTSSGPQAASNFVDWSTLHEYGDFTP